MRYIKVECHKGPPVPMPGANDFASKWVLIDIIIPNQHIGSHHKFEGDSRAQDENFRRISSALRWKIYIFMVKYAKIPTHTHTHPILLVLGYIWCLCFGRLTLSKI